MKKEDQSTPYTTLGVCESLRLGNRGGKKGEKEEGGGGLSERADHKGVCGELKSQ